MKDYQSDFEELRPLGEATSTPDAELSERTDKEPVDDSTTEYPPGYPDEIVPTESECASCGTSIPATQTKCEFCLTYHLDGSEDEQNRSNSESTLLHVVHLLVEASTFYAAVAKGSAAATLLSKPDKDSAVDECLMIYDLNEEPAKQLTDRWPSLPEAVRVTSERGRQLLAAARDRTVWTDEPQSPHEDRHETFLYGEAGYAITEENQFASQLEDPDDLWLVPAIALQDSVDDVHEESHQPSVPTKHRMGCWECDRETEHRFDEFESLPSEDWSGQPIWECRVCGNPRYGPQPK
jgi:predicted nucleic acid-binding Zn ribbon protein